MSSTFSICQDSEINGDNHNDGPNPAEDWGDYDVADGPQGLGPDVDVVRQTGEENNLSADLSPVFPSCCRR